MLSFSHTRSFCAAAILLVLLSGAASAEYRTALLIGNSDYPNAQLTSPARDVKAMAKALEQRGFTVTVAENLTGEAVTAAVNKFRRSVPTNATALVYFSGYVLQGERGDDFQDNVLLPIDGNASQPREVMRKPFGVKGLLFDLHNWRHQHIPSGAAASIVIVEGGYAHPDQKPTSPQGAAQLDAKNFPPNSLAAYGSSPGRIAEPSRDGVSPFTAKLVNQLGNRQQTLVTAIRSAAEHVESNFEKRSTVNVAASRAVAPSAKMPTSAKVGDEWVNDVGMIFCWCPPGKVTLGSPPENKLRFADEDQVEATISTGYWMGKYELTAREYGVFAERRPYYANDRPSNQPITGVDIRELNERVLKPLNADAKKLKTLPAGWEYGLPTEAQWEHAARAGASTTWYFGDDINELPRHANFADKQLFESPSGRFGYSNRTLDDGYAEFSPVGSFLPNRWGLHDVYGNVWEWCDGKYTAQLVGGVDPPGSQDPKQRESLARGGCRLSPPEYCRSAMRNGLEPGLKHDSYNFAGFRLVIRKTNP